MTLFKVLTLVPLLLTARRTLAQVACKDGWDWVRIAVPPLTNPRLTQATSKILR